MVTCLRCGYENPPGELICSQCDSVLVSQNEATPAHITRRLDNEDEIGNYPRWGTARLGSERKLLLRIRDHDEPIVVPVSEVIVLGRRDSVTGEAPRVDLTEYGAEAKGVSRRHASIIIEDDTLKVVDMGSANFTHINGQKLIAHQARILRDGDELRLGHLVIHIHFA